jgi:hypothetical protein
MSLRTSAEDAGDGGARHGHGVGMHDPRPRVVTTAPGRQLVGGWRATARVAAVVASAAATPATTTPLLLLLGGGGGAAWGAGGRAAGGVGAGGAAAP